MLSKKVQQYNINDIATELAKRSTTFFNHQDGFFCNERLDRYGRLAGADTLAIFNTMKS